MSEKRDHWLDKAAYQADITNSSFGAFVLICGAILAIPLFIVGACSDKEKQVSKKPRTESISHKIGKETREDFVEFTKGVIGIKSSKEKDQKSIPK